MLYIDMAGWPSLQEGWAPLHRSARYGHLHIVRELIEKMNVDVLAQKPVRHCVDLSFVFNGWSVTDEYIMYSDYIGPSECPPPCCHWRPLGDCQVPHAHIWRQ